MALRPSSLPQRVVMPEPPASSLPHVTNPESDLACAASPTVTRLLATVVTDSELESTATFALVTELVDFAARSRLDYVASLVTEFESVCPLSVGGELALSNPDTLDIPTPRSYAEAIAGEYSSQWQTAMDAEMASWKSTAIYVDEVPPSGANIVDGMWIFIVKRPPGSPPAFKARYVARGFKWHDTQRTTFAALGFAPSSADPSLFLRTVTTLPPFYVLVYVDDLVFATADTEALALVKAELQKRHTCTDLGELHSYLGLQITLDKARRTITLTQSHMVHQVLQRSSCEAEIYAVVMAAQELRWLTYLRTDLGERPRSPPVMYIDNKAMLALCHEQRLEHRTKHIALRYFIARELQQRRQLRLSYVASQANTADMFTKALGSGDHQRFCTALGLVSTLPHLLVA
ncbi:unnamed protein product [Closterium sp. NIES-54]